MAIDFNHGYTASWRVCKVDAGTWEPCGDVHGIETITIERDGGDKAPMLESATVTATLPAAERFEPGWHRIYMDAVQGRYSESVPIATLWLEAASGVWSKGARIDEIKGSSVLLQASEQKIGDGSYAPIGIDGADWARRTLAASIDAPVTATGGFELARSIVFDLKATVLAAVWAVLKEGGWCIVVDGHGDVSIEPMPAEPALTIDRDGASIVMPRVTSRNGTLAYRREWQPGVHPFSIVRGVLPESGFDGDYRVKTQRLTCGKGIVVEETLEAM